MKSVRRDFITNTTLLSGALLAPKLVSAKNNRKLNIACVGVGGAGGNFLRDKALTAEKFVAFAEVADREGEKI